MNELVLLEDGQALTTSRAVAWKFGKEHKHILRDIRNLECSDEFRQSNFGQSSYYNEQNKEMPEYKITRDGFVFLVMGFTGSQAAKFKEEYIAAFNAVEQSLKSMKRGFDPNLDNPEYFISQALVLAHGRMEALKEENTRLKQSISAQAPKVLYVNNVLASEECHTITTIAKEIGMGPKKLNQILRERGVQYFHDGHWVLYHKYQDKGFTKTRTHSFLGDDGKMRTSVQTVWTEKGRAWLHHLLGR